jgi:hypothetical protein
MDLWKQQKGMLRAMMTVKQGQDAFIKVLSSDVACPLFPLLFFFNTTWCICSHSESQF